MSLFHLFAVGALLCALFMPNAPLLGRILLIFAAANNWLFGMSIFNDLIELVGSVAYFVDGQPNWFGPEAVSGLILVMLGLTASLSYRDANTQLACSYSALQVPPLLANSLLGFCAVATIFISIKFGQETLFGYADYGSIKDYNALFADDKIGKLIITTYRMGSALLIVLAMSSFLSDDRKFFWFSLPLILFAIGLGLAEGSRIVAVYFAIASIAMFIGKRTLLAAVLVLLAFASISYALEARNHAELGLSSVVQQLIFSFENGQQFQKILANVSSGLLVTSASVQTAVPENYDTAFKVLSFMPTIDAIDGFQSVKALNEQRVLHYVPFNAFGEAWVFGSLYFFLFWGIVFVAMRSVSKTAQIGAAPYLFVLAIFLLALFFASQYPIRNCLRYFYLAILFSQFFNWYARRSASNLAVA
ncbi:hypothetical protein [Maritalea sp.]|uniref:hypothetical protein n=1 Tax=Maritalea sp. TaxID=2003361 RepID=UPI003EF8A65B